MTMPLPSEVIRLFLADVGITPQAMPAEYDRLQRALNQHWMRGGSVRHYLSRYTVRRSLEARRYGP